MRMKNLTMLIVALCIASLNVAAQPSSSGKASSFGSKPAAVKSAPVSTPKPVIAARAPDPKPAPVAISTPRPLFTPGTTSATIAATTAVASSVAAGTTSTDLAAKTPVAQTPDQKTVADFKARNTPAPVVAQVPAPQTTVTPTVTNVTNVTNVTRYRYVNTYRPPAYTSYYLGVHPFYGSYQATALWALLEVGADYAFYYNHRYEPAFVSWRSDAQMLCAQGNTQVCQQLAGLDQSVARMQAQNITVNNNYIPQNLQPEQVAQPVAQAAPVPETPTSYTWVWFLLGGTVFIVIGLVALGRSR